VAADSNFEERVLPVLVVGKRCSGDDDDNHDQQYAVAAHGSVSSPVAMVVIIISVVRARSTSDAGLNVSQIEVTADDRGHARPLIAIPYNAAFRRVQVVAESGSSHITAVIRATFHRDQPTFGLALENPHRLPRHSPSTAVYALR
jgi:hypothetical protein